MQLCGIIEEDAIWQALYEEIDTPPPIYLTGQIVAIRLPGFLNVPCWPRMHGHAYHIATTCKPMAEYVRQHVFAFRSKSKDVCAVMDLIVQIEHVIPLFRGMALPTHGYTRPVML